MGRQSSKEGVRYWTSMGSVEDENVARFCTAAGAGVGAEGETIRTDAKINLRKAYIWTACQGHP